MSENLVIPVRVAQAIGDYLSHRPWREVNLLIAELQKLQPAEPKPTSTASDSQS